MPSTQDTGKSLSKPRVLFLAKVYPYPPATAGDAVYSKGLVEAFDGTCDLTVLCADSGATRRDPKSIDWHIVGPQRSGRAGSVLSKWPLIAWKGATREFHRELDLLLKEKWDAIVLDNLGSVHALPKARKYKNENPETKIVYVSHEYEYPTRCAKYESYKLNVLKAAMAARDLAKVRESEISLLKSSDIVTVINEDDLAPFRKIVPEKKFLPLLPGYDGPITPERTITAETPRRLLILGGRRSEQKRQILLDWMELAYERTLAANIEMVVVGDMEDSLRQTLEERYPKTEVLGFVDDLEALIATGRAGLIADTVGGGFKLRLLSHVFQRLPIIGLSDAIAGLPTPEGEGYIASGELGELVDLVCERIDDIDKLNAIQNKAFQDCAEAFSWVARAEVFKGAIGENGAAFLK